MTSHVFVVDRGSYPVHRDRMFCGVKRPNPKKKAGGHNPSHYQLLADVLSLRKGDLVFFYQMHDKDSGRESRGFRGVFRVAGEPYYDEAEVRGLDGSSGPSGSERHLVYGSCPHCGSTVSEKCGEEDKKKVCRCLECKKALNWHILPYRIPIEPVQTFVDGGGEEAAVQDNTAYISRRYIGDGLPVLWTLLFRKVYGAGRERSIAQILPEESRKLEHIFREAFREGRRYRADKYVPAGAREIRLDLDTKDSGELAVEGMLQAWIMKNAGRCADPVLSGIVGDADEIEFMGCCVLYGIGGENVDVLIVHKKNGVRTHATVMELKKGGLKRNDADQIAGYLPWVAQLVFGDDSPESLKKIQPVLIGHRLERSLKSLQDAPAGGACRPIKILSYGVSGQEILFSDETGSVPAAAGSGPARGAGEGGIGVTVRAARNEGAARYAQQPAV